MATNSPGFSLKIGEGVAGRIAADAQPIVLRHAATDPIVKSQAIREKGVRALYGVPLSHAGSVIGVAYMGSRTAFDFSEEDKLLFRTNGKPGHGRDRPSPAHCCSGEHDC